MKNSKFEDVRFHRSIAAGFGAGFGSGEIFTGLVFSVVWLIGEVVSFVVFGDHETK